MDRDEVLKRLRKMEEVTCQPAVTAVIALIEDGRPVDESLLDGMMAVVRSLAELSNQFLELKVSLPQPAVFIPIGKGPWSDLSFARQVFPPKKEEGDDQA